MDRIPSSLRELIAHCGKHNLHGRYRTKRIDKLWMVQVTVGDVTAEGRGSDRACALNRAAEQVMDGLNPLFQRMASAYSMICRPDV